MQEPVKVVLVVDGGVVTLAEKESFKNLDVTVRDYDWDGLDVDLKTDDQGDHYYEYKL
jgi:hypothetical protein